MPGELAIGDDGRYYYCASHGLYFCTTVWHPTSLKWENRQFSYYGAWSNSIDKSALKLTNNTTNNKVAFYKVDNNYNKVGPFKVSSTIGQASSTVTVSYKDKNGNVKNNQKAELINFGWGKEFYVKVPNNVVQLTNIHITASYKATRTREKWENVTRVYKTYATIYCPTNGGTCGCTINGIQDMQRTDTERSSTPEKETVNVSTSIDINGPWGATGDLEISKVDKNNNNIKLKNTEFKLLSGKDNNKAMVIYKDGKKVDRIVVDSEINLK